MESASGSVAVVLHHALAECDLNAVAIVRHSSTG
jgi:hypothetical protein